MKKLRIVLMAVLMLITSVPVSALTVSAQSADIADERTIVREVTGNRSTRGDIEISSFTVTGVVSGAEQQTNGDWVWTPGNESSGHKFVFRVAFSVSGAVSLPAGSISIKIPLHILKDKNGSFADAIKVSYPAREDALDTNVFAYDVDESSNTVIITNLLDINEAIDSYFEVSYFTTKRTCDYYDYDPQGTQSYDDASDPFSAHIEIVAEDGSLTADTENVPVYINTSAKLISTEKRYPNIYRSFNSSWATYADPTQAPGRIWNRETGSWQDVTFNVDDYDYLIWEVKSKIKKDVTQYYRFTLDDHDYIDTTPIQYPEDDDLILVGYRFAGQTSYSLQNYVDNQLLDGDRYDWVLTAVKKSTYEKLNFSWYEESTQYIWSVKNSVTATLDPVDQVDPDSTAGGDRTFQYENHFVPIPGIFKVYKFGNINWNAAKRTELLTGYPAYWDYSSYQLREFAAGQIDHFDLFYAVCAYGTPYKCTVLPGEDPNDPENYWKSPITYIVTDENLRLQYEEVNGSREGVNYSPDGELLLTEGDGPVLGYRDYYLKKLYFKLTISDAVYASEDFGFVGVDGTFGDSEAVYLEVLTGKGWMPAATYYPSDQSFSEVESRYITLTETNVTPTEGPRCSQHDYVAVSFKEDYGIYGYRLKTTNTHFYTRIDAMPVFTLKHDEESGRVMELVNWLLEEGNDKGGTMFIFNEVNHTVNTAYDQLQNEYIYSGNILQSTESSRYTYKEYEWARDAVRVSEMDSSLSKKVIGASNNTANEEYTISWKVIMKEELTDQQGRSYIPQNSGTFYDLLPAGLTLDRNSVAVQYEGGYLTVNNGISIRTIDNYQGTGRTMLIVDVTTPGKYYNLYYDTICSWDSLSAFGREVLNPVAYQTGNDRIAEGYPDDGGNLTGDNKDLMSNLCYDESQTDIPEQFIYAQQTFDIDAITNAIAGLYKRVKNEAEDSRYKAETMVEPNGTYSYLLRFKNTLTTSARDLVFFDSLENYARGSEHQYPSDWHGTLIDLDLSTLIAQGIKPKVYVSTVSGLDVSEHNDLTEASVWTLLDESKWHDAAALAGVKAIAIDMREAADGKDFVLEANGTIMATLYMKAPAAATRSSGEIYPETYNNIYISSTLINDVHDEESFFIHQDYTIVKFRPKADVHIHKVNAQDRNENIKGIVFTLY
ncbi:MAG: hypothetical protein J5887_02585, partial [Erysipelotrichaceae bacterium]|nr:hypothetical protein [Erysipelotrichaceae bacterium]